MIAINESSLPDLASGERRQVDHVAELPGFSKRLADMGFVRGAELTMVRPGSPCIVRIDGRFVGLGRGYQQNIKVTRRAV